MGRGIGVFGAICFAGALWSGSALAESAGGCFRVAGEATTSGGRVQHVVGLTSTVRLSQRCAYGLGPQGPWFSAGELAGGETDFLELLELLGSERARPTALSSEQAASPRGSMSRSDPRFLFGRLVDGGPRRAEGEELHTLILRYCTHYLLEEQLGFQVLPAGAEGGFRLERLRQGEGPRCDAEQTELRAVRGGASALLSRAPRRPEETLEVGEGELSLPRGEWVIYAARPAGRVALRVGVFRSTGVVTALQHHLRTVGRTGDTPEPLLATAFPQGAEGLLLVPTQAASSQPLLWPELRTAADAGLLWLARAESAGDAPFVVAPLGLEGGETAAVRFPDRPVLEHMRARYGEAGEAMTPTLDDWQQIFAGLSVCLTPSYLTQEVAGPGGAVPDPASCAALEQLLSLEEAGFGGGAAPTRVCLHRGLQVIGASGSRRVEPEGAESTCFALPARGEPMPFHVAVVGDQLTLEGGAEACLLIDNQSLLLREGRYLLERSGLLEVRQGGGVGCNGAQALSRLRLPVLDPEREWHPVGLLMSDDDEAGRCTDEAGAPTEQRCPWRALRSDEEEVFAYRRSRQSMEFRLSTSPMVAAAINRDPGAPVLVSQDVPLLSGVEGDLEGARAPALVAFVSRDGVCPTGEGGSVDELRRRRPLEPDGQVVDRVFHVILASVEGADQPPHCLARAAFRVHPSRALYTTAGDRAGFEVGLLGDLQLVTFVFPRPQALGLALPVVYARLNLFPIRLQRWLALEIAGNLTFAASFDPAGVSRTGASLSAAIQLGVPPWVPRLLSFGVMLFGAFDSVPEDPGEDNNPIWSLFLGLDLSTLVDLAGGR